VRERGDVGLERERERGLRRGRGGEGAGRERRCVLMVRWKEEGMGENGID
jgi:hypothetical protein